MRQTRGKFRSQVRVLSPCEVGENPPAQQYYQCALSPASAGFLLAKKSTTARGYGTVHQSRRRQISVYVNAGLAACQRCGEQILPGQAWDLDHRDDRRGWLGASHASCNRATAKSRRRSREW